MERFILQFSGKTTSARFPKTKFFQLLPFPLLEGNIDDPAWTPDLLEGNVDDPVWTPDLLEGNVDDPAWTPDLPEGNVDDLAWTPDPGKTWLSPE